jgi:hypothetical protein
MNNLNEILNFIKKNNNYSDRNNINNYLNNLNFTNYIGGGKPILKDGKWYDNETNAELTFKDNKWYDNETLLDPQPEPPAEAAAQPVEAAAQPVEAAGTTEAQAAQAGTTEAGTTEAQAAQAGTTEAQAAQAVAQTDTTEAQAAQAGTTEAQAVAQTDTTEAQAAAQTDTITAQPVAATPQLNQSSPIVKQEMPLVNSNVSSQQQQIDNEPNCVTTSILSNFGTTIESITCKNKNIIMPNLLIRPTITNSQVNTYTIKRGTILYHASKISGFNPHEIKLGKDNLISFFTPNFKLASFKVKGCDLDELNSFIHTFEVAKDIENIFIKLPYTTGNINLDDLKNQFCTNQIYNGVGFFFPKNDIELFNNVLIDGNTLELDKRPNDESYYSEFALCNPNEWLKYLISHSCKSYRSLSPAFTMNR